ncbi:MAG: SDR family NAD(P)-dependent oxidoreductase, partial [Alphaproteobacteria bacterium]|nr:SDR family NAD(P)-dependent oxidoreductase [Alphaproteobacteria bacterium]
MKRLDGKTALITGASSGIGRAIARKFQAEGATLLLMDITEAVVEGGEPTHKILDVPFFQGDVSSEADVEEAVRRATLPTGRLDIVVNDAVIRVGKKLTDTSLEEWNRVMAVNLAGVFLMCRAAVRQMLTQEIRHEARGRIVNISSQHGMISSPEDVSYGTSKAGVVYLTRQIAADYGRD